MSYYGDSSFLVSCYLLDANTPRANSYLSGLTAPLPFTPLQTLEVGNAFELGVFRGLFSAADAAAARANLRAGPAQRPPVAHGGKLAIGLPRSLDPK